MGFKDILKGAFPFIAIAAQAGGPLGALAANMVGQKLGIDKVEPTTDGISDAITMATTKDPEAMLKLKQVEEEFQAKMLQMGIDSAEKFEEIAAADRSDARAREIAVKDRTPSILAYLTLAGFFALLTILMFHNVPSASHDILVAMTGALGGAYLAQQNYYFGSSAGSAEKNRILETTLKGD